MGGDGKITLITAMTGGGGALVDSNPFGGSSGSAETSTSDDGPSEALSSSSGSDSGDGGEDVAFDGPAICANYVAPMCGSTPCDLRSNTCCVTPFPLSARCIPGANTACMNTEATFHCQYSCECPTGQVCCGIIDTLVGFGTASCQTVPAGGFCPPHPNTVSQAAAQLCKDSSECANGQPCISQTCIYSAMFQFCGLQSQSPYNCMAN
jgi:hypothetical protein